MEKKIKTNNSSNGYSQAINYIDENFLEIIDEIKKINKDKNLKYFNTVYGCQMNEHDNEKIAWMLELMGYQKAENIDEADFLLFNTCAIRENAELKVYGKLGSLKTLKEEKPDLKIAVCGCMMQVKTIRSYIEEKFKHVDIIFGTHNINKLPELYLENYRSKKTAIEILEDNFNILEGTDYIRESKHTAYVNIMFGCNNFCTYCIVPHTRGREISRNPKDILAEIKNLARLGYKEVILLGQNVNSYGKTLQTKYSFTDLLYDIHEIEEIKIIRFMTSHPKDISDELIEAYGKLDKLENHLHLPVQSGSDQILSKMNRHYTRKHYLKIVEKIRRVRPNISISTDIIVGFPGETEEDFLETLSLIKKVRYDFVYNFIYSVRPGTKAANFDNHVTYNTKHERFEKLNKEINKISLEKNQKLIGTTVEVLVDNISKNNVDVLSGRTSDFKIVNFKGSDSLIGELVKVRIKDAKTFSLEGEII